MRKKLLSIFTYWIAISVSCSSLVLAPSSLVAQRPQSWTSSEINLALRKLNVLGSVLYMAAHPDDENTRLITYFSKDRLYRTGYLSLTRGDGGQNLIGDEQGIELGLIRTQELLAARRIDGGEQFFSRAYDFGFSKNPEETFTKWDKEKILSDVVAVIRRFRPDVIITRFPTTGEGGHGHHTASAILANEAFVAAADPNRFPEQLKQGLEPWQVKRVMWNTFNFGTTNTITDDQFKVDVGGYSPLLGKSYGEIAAESRSQHKSQGFGVPSSRGESLESFKTTSGSTPVNDLFDEIDVSWNRVPGGAVIGQKVEELIAGFDLLHPENSVQKLVGLYKEIRRLPESYWRNQKLKEVKELVEQCSGLFLDATTNEQFAVRTDSVKVFFSFNNRLGADAILQSIRVDEFDSSFSIPLHKNRNLNFVRALYVPTTKPLTQPYWLAAPMEEGYFNVKDFSKIGQPDVDAAYPVEIGIKIFGELFRFERTLKYRFTDPVKGELYEPVVVVPPVVISADKEMLVTSKTSGDEVIDLSVRAFKKISFDGQETPTGPTRNFISFGPASLEKDQIMSRQVILNTQDKDAGFDIRIGTGTDAMNHRLHEIRYAHIPYINYYTTAQLLVRHLDLKTYHKKIGYIVGAGDKVPVALEQMGYDVTLLGDKELSRNNLQQYDAIFSGVRAYNTNDWLYKYYDKLMKYVSDGGNYIVQYNTNNFISSIKNKIGPYSFDITRTRVTDENAEVRFLKHDHPVLNFPNKITQADFRGWVQERSIYHAGKWDRKYETIFSLGDPGESQDEGSLIIAKHGKGYFTYTGLVFFRELPAGVSGAYRLLANIIALNRKKAF